MRTKQENDENEARSPKNAERRYTPVPVHRFFAPDLNPGDDTVVLPRGEAEHLTRVLRIGVGDTVSVFDGRGHEFMARVIGARHRTVHVQIVTRVEPAHEWNVSLTLAQAVLKGDKMDDVIRDAVMLGVSAIQPLVTKRTETTVAALLKGARVERWRRVVLASAKQSGRAVLPEVRTPLTIENFLAEPAPALRIMLVEPSANEHPEPLSVLRDSPIPADAGVMIGPEGGWTDEECSVARKDGVRLISLGPRTLRADAVGVSALSVLHFLWES
jgi:16S rRNA (uracil1498-N3)-methyltransferase